MTVCLSYSIIMRLAEGKNVGRFPVGGSRLHEDLSPRALTALLRSHSHIEIKAGALIQGDPRGGGNDNITVVLAEVCAAQG